MQEATVVYILYPNLTNPKEVLLLKKLPKKKVPTFLWNKLIGLGGFVEPKKDGNKFPDRIINSTIRELKEEIELFLNKQDTMVISGKAFMKNQNLKLYFIKLALPYKITKTSAKKEGPVGYFDINFHKQNPDLFPEEDLELLDLMYRDEYFDIVIEK